MFFPLKHQQILSNECKTPPKVLPKIKSLEQNWTATTLTLISHLQTQRYLVLSQEKKHNKRRQTRIKHFFDTQIGQIPAPGMVAKFQAFEVCGKKSLTPHTLLWAEKKLWKERTGWNMESSVFVHILWKHYYIANH